MYIHWKFSSAIILVYLSNISKIYFDILERIYFQAILTLDKDIQG